MPIEVIKVSNAHDLEEIHRIRHQVFVVEQAVDASEEYEFEDESIHFMALLDDKIAGTARYRKTDKGIKLERFAVLKNFRNRGVASALLKHILSELQCEPYIYLHAQITAVNLYSHYGFKQVGNLFYEAGIAHYKMEISR